ncbi:flagellar basal-body rod protein FlgC [Ligilactobacillus sp. WC1T17]|uniref:Flagellar basal-body rod protein FlgC n=1 Tax=Ligilactobacillus ruminis TaxID=1623 RepID=A0ABY1AB30_9LACO|nr:flagellar basal-body rod protein FlgC [Ligilactobacillus ruminis]
MSIFNGLQINASGLSLERLKLDVASNNISNVNTTRTAEGGPYKKETVEFSENLKQAEGANYLTHAGVKVTNIAQDDTTKLTYDPDNPDANENGYVEFPNVNMADEMVDMIQAMRTYQANVSSSEANKTILKKALEISKD